VIITSDTPNVSARQLPMAVVHSPHPITAGLEVRRDLRQQPIVAPRFGLLMTPELT